ncbi:MAG: hypothetical protein AB8C95_10440 [Phycisphaeraceae bacterium]
MRRWIIHMAALMSLGLLFITGGLWYSSYQQRSEYGFYWKGKIVGVCSEKGLFHPFIDNNHYQQDFEWLVYTDQDVGDTYYDNYHWRRMGFGYGQVDTLTSVVAPFWFITPHTLILPAVSIYLLARRVISPGLCKSCGYDLRGSLEQASCPECGEALSKPTPICTDDRA